MIIVLLAAPVEKTVNETPSLCVVDKWKSSPIRRRSV